MKNLYAAFERVLAATLKEAETNGELIDLMSITSSIYCSLFITVYQNIPDWTDNPTAAGIADARDSLRKIALSRLLEIVTIVKSAAPDVTAELFTTVQKRRTIGAASEQRDEPT